MTSPDAAAVDLTSLEIIRRYSLAVRQDTASRGEVVAALRADLAWLEGGSRTGTRSRSAVAETERPPAPPAAAPATRAPAASARTAAPARKAAAPAKRAAAATKAAKKTSTPARTPAAKSSARRG